MKINRVSVLLGFCSVLMLSVATATKPTPKSWQANSQAVYDLLVAQMRNADADFGGSVDALVKYAKSQKDDQLYIKAYSALLRTQRYADAVKLVKHWQSNSQLKLEQHYVLALVLNDEMDLAMSTISKSLENTDNIENNAHLLAYLRILVTHWYNPNVLTVLSRLYEEYPENQLVVTTFVRQLRWRNEVDKAVAVLDKALFNDPKNIDLLQEKSDAYRYALQLEKAEQVWKNILKDYPNNREFQFAYARFLFDRYDFAAADKQLAAIRGKSELMLRVNLLRVMTKIQLGDYQSIDTVIDWRKLDEPEKNRLYYDIANFLLDAKQSQLAKQYFEKIDVVDETGQLALIKALKIGQIRYQESLEQGNQWFDDVADKFHLNQAELVQEKAEAMQAANRDKAAYQLLSDYLAANPNNEDIRYLRGLFAAEMHKEAIAAEDLGVIYAKSPDNTDVQNALGYTLLATADGDAAKLAAAGKLIQKALFSQPESPAIVDSMGWLHYQQQAYEQALPYLRFAYANYSDGEIIGHYIAALEKAGQHNLAKKLYQLEIKYPEHQEKINDYTKDIQEQLQP